MNIIFSIGEEADGGLIGSTKRAVVVDAVLLPVRTNALMVILSCTIYFFEYTVYNALRFAKGLCYNF